MASEIPAVPSLAATPPEEKTNDAKSGNLTAGQMAQQLLQRGREAAETPAPSADQVPASPPAEAVPTPAPDGEPPASPEATPEATPPAEDDVLSNNSLDPKLKEKIEKRIGKEVAKRKAMEAEIEQLKAKVQAPATPPPPAPVAASADQPLANINDVNSLIKEQASMKEVKRWAQAQLIRDDIGDGFEAYGRKWTRGDLQGAVLQADVVLEDQIPKRLQFLQQRQQAEQQAHSMFSWMKDKTSPEYVEYHQAMQQYPWLNNLPDAPVVVGVQIMGAKYMKEQAALAEKAKAKPAPAVTPPPASQTATGAAPGAIRETPNASAQKKLSAEIEKLKQKGNVTQRDMARVLQQQEISKRPNHG